MSVFFPLYHLTCLFSSSRPPARGRSAAAGQSTPPGSEPVCTQPPISRTGAPAPWSRRAAGCRSGTGLSSTHRPGSTRLVSTGTGCCRTRERKSSGLEDFIWQKNNIIITTETSQYRKMREV